MYFIRQKDAMDCGPTCLAILLAHFGRNPDIELIRNNCALTKEGVSLFGIGKAAETIGDLCKTLILKFAHYIIFFCTFMV